MGITKSHTLQCLFRQAFQRVWTARAIQRMKSSVRRWSRRIRYGLATASSSCLHREIRKDEAAPCEGLHLLSQRTLPQSVAL